MNIAYNEMYAVDGAVREINGPHSGELLRRCGLLHGEFRFGRIDDIFANGLHEYLSEFLERIYDLGDLIITTYFPATDEGYPAPRQMAPQAVHSQSMPMGPSSELIS